MRNFRHSKRNTKNYLFTSLVVLLFVIVNHFYGDDLSKFANSNRFYNNSKLELDSNSIITEEDTIDVNNDEFEKLLNEVSIGEEEDIDYDRDEWTLSNGYIFYDENRNEKTGIRNYVLSEATDCDIKSDEFSYVDPYSGETCYDYSELDYDHIIPINYVATHGGNNWTTEEKQEYYYDTENGVDVSASLNRSKSNKGPSEWMPEINQKWYCYKWLEVACRYDINISQDDYNTIVEVYENN